MENNPQIAYDSLAAIKLDLMESTTKAEEMKWRMLEAKALNKLYKQMPSDSVFNDVVEYYDKNGTNDDKAQCHYLLGCIYRDTHDAPKAIECYNTAIGILEDNANLKDTMNQQLLALSYGEVADLLYSQLLYTEAIRAYKQAISYAEKCGDYVIVANNYGYMSVSYTMQNMLDSAIAANETAADIYLKIGRKSDATIALGCNMVNYLETKDFDKLKYALDLYEKKYNSISEKEINKAKNLFYYYQGEYYLNTNNLDSARFCFYQELSYGTDFNTKQAATFGLSKLYTKLQMKDSAAKYATLSSQWNDSLSVNKQTEVTAKTNALFNYKKYKKKAHDMQIRKTNLEIIFLSVSVGFLLLLLLAYVLFIRRTKHISGTYNTELEKIQQDMEIAKSNIATERKRNERLISRNKELKIEKDIAEKNTTLLQDKLIGITTNNDNFDLDVVEQKLMDASIYKVIREYLTIGKKVNDSIMKKVSDLLGYNIPTFQNKINSSGVISNVDYNICLLIRLHFKPSEISRLLDIDPATLAMKRKRLLKRIYNKDGSSKDFDKFVENIY